MTVDFAKEYLLDDCADCPENKNGECMTQSHCFEVKRMAIQALEHTRWIPVSERLPKEGEDAEVMEEAIDRLMYINSLIDQYQREIELLDQDIQDDPRGMATVIKRAQMGMLYRVVSDLRGDK